MMNCPVRLLPLLSLALGCAALPDDPYQRDMALLDRQSALCGLGDGVSQISCQTQVAAKRQQLTAEEMSRRDHERVREQTEGIREAITAVGTPAAPAAPVMITQWCTVVVFEGKALESCQPERADCNKLWGDLRASGKEATDCAERTTVVAAPAATPAAVAPTRWCIAVTIEGAATDSCYPSGEECSMALGYHRQAGTPATDCVGK